MADSGVILGKARAQAACAEPSAGVPGAVSGAMLGARAGAMWGAVLVASASAFVTGCGEPPAERAAPTSPADAKASRPLDYESTETAWGRYPSKRFLLSIPLPDGRNWRVDDHSRPNLFAVHEATSSKLWLMATQEDELMNRQRCEARARELGWVPPNLTTVEDEVTVGPDAYDSRIWVAIDAGKPGGALEGHVFLFGAFIRRCLLVHVSTKVPSAKDENVLSSRLAVARARIVRGITLDTPRTTTDADVPRTKPDIRR